MPAAATRARAGPVSIAVRSKPGSTRSSYASRTTSAIAAVERNPCPGGSVGGGDAVLGRPRVPDAREQHGQRLRDVPAKRVGHDLRREQGPPEARVPDLVFEDASQGGPHEDEPTLEQAALEVDAGDPLVDARLHDREEHGAELRVASARRLVDHGAGLGGRGLRPVGPRDLGADLRVPHFVAHGLGGVEHDPERRPEPDEAPHEAREDRARRELVGGAGAPHRGDDPAHAGVEVSDLRVVGEEGRRAG